MVPWCQPIILAVLLLTAAPAVAAEQNPFAWPAGHRGLIDGISYGTVAANLVGDTWNSWRAPDRPRALGCQALRVGLVVAIAEVTKRLVHRTRPDGSDRLSFFSEHTALAAVSTPWMLRVSIPMAGATGYGRMAANRHWPTDVLTGAAVGAAVAGLVRCGR